MSYPPNRNRNDDYPSEFGNYPRRPDRWDEERGPRSFVGDPPRDRFGDPYAEGGEHAGRGPKNYLRSDERIREDACERLTQDEHVDASEIEVSVKDGEITLEGTIPERRMKRIAEDCMEAVSGARQVHNRLRVETRTGERNA